VSNLERDPDETVAGGLATVSVAPTRRVLEAREVPLGGTRAMLVRRTLPHRDLPTVGAWCFADDYGPTELAGVCANHRLPDDPADWLPTGNGTVPIGAVYPHLESVLVGPDGRPADEGELCVRGVQRFPGYVDPAANAGRFFREDGGFAVVRGAPRPDDWYRTGDRVRREHGALVHLGRVDRQVKLRGYRVELDEVEAAVRSHPAVREAAVLVADAQLVAVYAADADGPASAELRGHVAARLPDYMVPVTWRRVDRLPTNQNGKLDRTALEGR